MTLIRHLESRRILAIDTIVQSVIFNIERFIARCLYVTNSYCAFYVQLERSEKELTDEVAPRFPVKEKKFLPRLIDFC